MIQGCQRVFSASWHASQRSGGPFLWVVAFAVLLVPKDSRSAHPLATEDGGTVGGGTIEAEMGYEYGSLRQNVDGLVAREDVAEAALNLAFGIIDDLDLLVFTPILWTPSRDDGSLASEFAGLGDMCVEVKWNFFRNNSFALTLKPTLGIPTGDSAKGLGAGVLSYGAVFVVSTTVGEQLSFELNGVWNHLTDLQAAARGTTRADIGGLYVAAIYNPLPSLSIVGELLAESNADRSSNQPVISPLVGLIYSVSDNLDLDVGVRAALLSDATYFSGLAGVTYRR